MTATMILSILALLSAVLYLRAIYQGPQRQVYLFKPLTTALILAIVLLAAAPPSQLFKWLIVAGLLFCLAGDVILLLPARYFIVGLGTFLLAHLVFTAAFISDGGPFWSPWLLVAGLAFGLVLMCYLWPHLGKVRIPAAIYMLVVIVMAWQAGGRIAQGAGLSGWLAFAGAVLFVASDSILTVNRFARPFRSARLIYMSAYYLALWLIALSVVVG
jgi:uncharacterized membrane protein YhhN